MINITEGWVNIATGSTGNCYLCGAELGKTAMKNHLLKAHSGEDGGQECSLLKIEGAYDKDYWLFIDLPTDKSLTDVDKFLRKIWLECCGHMSAFCGPKKSDVAKSRKLYTFSVGGKFSHEYDFGTTTETIVTVDGTTKRKPQREIVRLLARNVPPQFRCAECGSPAGFICTQCVYETDNPFYCDECGYDGELDIFAFNPGKIMA